MATATVPELRAKLATLRRLRDEEEHNWEAISRPNQREPDGEWGIWVLLAGRGFGKSRSLSEALRRRVREGLSRESAIVGATAADSRDVMVEGPAGVLACCTARERPTYEPSKRKLAWPNGAVSHVYSADEPDRLPGPQHDFAIGDELRAWRHLEESVDNLLLGLRMGSDPRAAFATTPSGRSELRALLERPGTRVTRGTTFENLPNLPKAFRERVVAHYEGSRIAAQELRGELIEQVEGALWKRDWIEANHVDSLPHPASIIRAVVALDPAGGTATGDEQALCGAIRDRAGFVYITRSEGQRTSPLEWLKRAIEVAREISATIVVERNYGGKPLIELLEQAMGDAPGTRAPYMEIHASQSKALRAEGPAIWTEKGRVKFVGRFPELEEQLCTWVPGDRSPDRLDAFVHAVRELASGGMGPSTGRDAGRAVPYRTPARGDQNAAVLYEGAFFSTPDSGRVELLIPSGMSAWR
jgi:phage terminase large subunit-like protein